MTLKSHMRNKQFILRESWIWEEGITELVKKHMSGYTLNVCCGQSEIGDVRIDLDPNSKATHYQDMNSIEFPSSIFDSVISDPPWKLGYYQRTKPFFECVRVCKVNGKIIYNAPWIPQSKAVKLDNLWIRKSAWFGNVSIISIFNKTTTRYDHSVHDMIPLDQFGGDNKPT